MVQCPQETLCLKFAATKMLLAKEGSARSHLGRRKQILLVNASSADTWPTAVLPRKEGRFELDE